MKLKDLLDSARCGPGQLPATNGFVFPPIIELPNTFNAFLANKWTESEQKREEIGGNLRLVAPLFSPRMDVGRQRSNSAPAVLSQLEFQPIDVVDGQGGNSVSIYPRTDSDIVADFHTHPSTPGGRNLERCGYQPPSIEDVMAMAEQAKLPRNIFISFVVAARNDIYAMVYVRGVARFTNENQEKIYSVKQELGDKGKRIKFPTDKHEEEFFTRLGTKMHLMAEMEKELELKMNYGEEFSKIVRYYLGITCQIFSLRLYHGNGPNLARQDY